MKNILIVGSTGKVGKSLTAELVKSGEPVLAATRNPLAMKADRGVTPVRFDYTDPASFGPALKGVDRVFLLEPQVPLEISPEDFMRPFLEVAMQEGRKIVLMTTLSAEFEDGQEPMLKVESIVEQSGAPFVILRPNWFMDNFHTLWLPPIQQAGVIPVPAGDSRSAFIDSRDIGASAAAVLRTNQFDGRILSLTGPEALSYHEAAATLSKTAGKEIQYVPVDDESFIKSMTDAGLPEDNAAFIDWIFQWTRKGKAATVSSTVADLTGRAPRNFTQYAEDHASAWK